MSAKITYGNKISETISGGEAIELECSGYKMTSNVIVECTDEPAEDTNGSYDEGYAAGKADGYLEGEAVGYDKGIGDGYDNGRAAGLVEGKKAEYDAFWDACQNNGNRKSYQRAFDGYVFSFGNFYPKYDIKPTNGNQIFYAWEGIALPNQKGSLTQRLNDCDVILDTSLCTDLSNAFAYSQFTSVPVVDFTSLTKNNGDVFRGCSAVEIQKIIVKSDTTYSNWFVGCRWLSYIRVEGAIGNDINFKDSPLDKDSITDIMSHLSTETTGKTATFKESAVNTAFETSAGASDGSTSAEWTALIATKSNWTISLV